MRAYNETWIENKNVVSQAERWHRRSLLTDDQLTAVRKAYPVGFQTMNGFLEIGLFIFTIIATGGVFLLFVELLSIDDSSIFGLYCLLFGIGLAILNNVLIRRRQFYRNGVDNALVMATTALMVGGFNSQFLDDGSLWQWCLVALPLLAAVVWYYGDTLITFIALAVLYTCLFDLTLEASFGRTLLPFVGMVVSGLLMQATRMIRQRAYYDDAVSLTQWVALAMLLVSVNYYVVRETNWLLIRSTLRRSGVMSPPEIDLPWLFWLLTVGLPIGYLWQGFVRKNRMLIILGVLGVAAAVATIRYYVGILPLNVHLTLCGLFLIGIAVGGIRYLRSSRYGFTDVPDEDSPDEFLISSDVITAAQVAAGTSGHDQHDNVKFGGGKFGGGGAGGGYN
ncbi:hypothetical protein BN8_04874 [Fibrisoma limi BUZ 3]|uniref:DUF2157 domain-containing protein n=1 Tax=Fibrisoma limi BUZ 3 TaxID=1185876 RepID=I2GNX7_9BACT|nr:hypothetical protein [Fibrisoma limi]CCH55605.1 hypothetical protein BN8_04874 [Fibrisoma limi BUZ 3]